MPSPCPSGRGFTGVRMGMVAEFKEFAMRGNVVDMAVGVVIGGAFGKIVSSMVGDVIMPVVGKIVGNVDFSSLYIDLSGAGHASLAAAKEAGAATLNYGLFINSVFDFVIVAACIFAVIKLMNRMKKTEAPAPAAPTTKDCPECCLSIPIKAKRCGHCAVAVG